MQHTGNLNKCTTMVVRCSQSFGINDLVIHLIQLGAFSLSTMRRSKYYSVYPDVEKYKLAVVFNNDDTLMLVSVAPDTA